jgi:zinc transport system substrate-binding protein
MRFFFCLLALFGTTLSMATPNVVVSIKPIHSLVTGLMRGVAKPALLINTTQSPHHYSLKPSDRRLLAKADLIFWVGPELEGFMPRLLKTLPGKTRVVSLIENASLTKLPLRQISNHDHQQNHPVHNDASLRIDAHIWLDTHNADILVDAITQQLVSIDPANTQQYKKNQKNLHSRINTLRKTLAESLDKEPHPFLSYHDAYQYFEHEFELNNSGFIVSKHELSPGARRILEIKKIIAQNSIQCIFYDAPFKPPVIDTLLNRTNANAIELDATGMNIDAGEQAWFIIMQTLGEKFKDCLQTN